ncbi:MAG: hypothetical protein KAH48_03210 [Chlorobi bacterium]|nr:hypothetical protein [Chlorobiota bacterium]
MKYILIGLVVLFLTLWFSTPTILAYLLYRWLKKKGYKKVGVMIVSVVTVFMVYFVYTGFYPTDSFYEGEFEYYTELEYPESGYILVKEATYPDLHGDYSSNAIFRVDSSDLNNILTKIQSNDNFENIPKSQGWIYGKNESVRIEKKGFTRNFSLIPPKKSEIRFFLSFDKQNNLIEFNRSSW